jgi:urease gamma subunit
VALITAAMMEGARDGRRGRADALRHLLTRDDVMDGMPR